MRWGGCDLSRSAHRRSLLRHLSAGLLAGAALLAWSSSALAHGRALAMMSFAVHPTDPAIMVAGTTFGAVLSQDGGTSWRWICEEAIGYEGDRFEARVVATSTGNLLAVGAGGGLRVSVDQGCSWNDAVGPAGQGVSDVAISPSPKGKLWVSTSRYEGDNAVWVSSNGGLSFTRTALVRERLFLSSIRRLPGPADRLRVAGWWFDPPRAVLLASDDGGESWREQPLPIDLPVYLASVSPDGARLWLRTNGPAGNWVWRVQADGGGARSVLEVPSAVRGVVETAEGRVWVAGVNSVLVSEDGGASWQHRDHPSRYTCLAARGGEAVACGSLVLDGWNAGASSDGGRSWRPLLRFPDIAGAIRCPRGSDGAQCASYWSELGSKLSLDPATDAGLDAGADAGADLPPPPQEGPSTAAPGRRVRGGCSVLGAGASPGPGSPSPLSLASIMVLAALRCRRRRK